MSIFTRFKDGIMEKITSDGYVMSEKEFFEAEIALWKKDEKRLKMIEGERYFRGDHDILKSERMAIGADGKLRKIENLPNNRIVNNQYQRLVNQKVNYLMGREFVIEGENDEYISLLKEVLGNDFFRTMKCLMRDAVNMGIGWLYVYADDEGKLRMRRLPAFEIIAYWSDYDHTKLDRAVRLYSVEGYKGREECVREMVEIYSSEGVTVYELEGGTLHQVEQHSYTMPYPGEIPLIAFKYNEKEIPLITRVKSLQDALNKTMSDFENCLQEDARNTILVLQNYDGTDLGEFRHNLSTYGAVKVKTVDGTPGDIKALTTDFNAGNYQAMADMLKGAMVENAMGYDAKNDRLGNSPNQLMIRAMFSDLDLDVSEIEAEFQYSFKKLTSFAKEYLMEYGYGCFIDEDAEIVFNRDCPVNESEAIDNCIKSADILSEETVILQHPWVRDVQKELKKKEGSTDGQK
ncbi:MAG: phage portal protein [Clostridia bacterium]